MKIENRIIEVSNNPNKRFWQKRILICIKNGKAICWNSAETLEEAEKTMSTSIWDHWKEIPEPKYRPFTWEDRYLIKGQWIRPKNKTHEERLVTNIVQSIEGIFYIQNGPSSIINAEILLANYEFVDGTPCGLLES